MRRFFSFFLLLCASLSVHAQIDNLFWFAAPDISANHAHNPITFCFTSFGNPAAVTISQPANPSFTPVTINLNPYSYYALDVTNQESIVETAPVNTVCNYGFKIVSTANITTYYQLGANNSEIYTLKGRNGLGTDFIVPMQNFLVDGPPTDAYNSIEIVATEDNTTVTIVPSRPLMGGVPAGLPITITLNAGQSYCVKSADQTAAGHLTNTRITSNKPIAVNSTDDSVASNQFSGYSGQDLVGEQIVPLQYAGTLFIATRNNRAFEGLTVTPTQDSTRVFINGSTTPAAILNMDQTYTYMMSQSPMVATMVTTDKPAFVFELTGSDGECGGTVLPAIGCTGSNEVVYARPSYSTNMKLTIVVHTTDVAGFTVNGSSNMLTASDFTQLPYDPTWSYCYKDFTSLIPTLTVMTIKNSLGPFHLGVLDYYTGMSSSLGYFSGYNSQGVVELVMSNEYCLGDSVEFAYRTNDVDTLKLVTPSGDTLSNPPFVIESISALDTGKYYILAHNIKTCDKEWTSDSICIHVVNVIKPDLGPDQFYCYGERGEILSNYPIDNVDFYWNTGDTTPNISTSSDGVYILNVTTNAGNSSISCQNSDTVQVLFYERPRVDFETEGATSGCAPLQVNLLNKTTIDTSHVSYVWTILDEEGHLVSQSLDESPTITFADPGTYTVELYAVTDDGCADSLFKWNLIHCYLQPEADFAATPSVVHLSENGGEVAFTAYLSENVDSTSAFITWDFGDGEQENGTINPVHAYHSWGDYVAHLTVSTDFDCSAEISHTIIVEADLIFPNVITPNGDGSNDVFAIGNLNTNINMEDPDEYRTNDLMIYDRWGKLVFKAHNYDTYAKDGQVFVGSNPFTAENCSDGVYYYSFYYKGHYKETKYNGSLTIIR